MKKYLMTVCVFASMLLSALQLTAQPGNIATEGKIVSSYKVAVSYNKTSNVIFPFPIKSIDRGSTSIIVQKANAVENILQLKAATHGFVTTNLTVITADGKFYSFLVDYANEPHPLNMSFIGDTSQAIFPNGVLNEEQSFNTTEKVLLQPAYLHRSVTDQKTTLRLTGIYLVNSVMCFRIIVRNESSIPFKTGQVRFLLQDRKRTKRTAVQAINLKQMIAPGSKVIEAGGEGVYVYGVAPFTIPSQQKLIINIAEKERGRMLKIAVKPKTISDARIIEN